MSVFGMDRRSVLKAALGMLAGASAVAPTSRSGSAAELALPQTPSPAKFSHPIDAATLLDAQLWLGNNLIDHLARADRGRRNIVVSPASLTAILAFLDIGASNQMRAALHRSLGLSVVAGRKTSDDFSGIRSTVASVLKRANEDGPLTLANMIVFDLASRPFHLSLLGLTAAGADVLVEDIRRQETIGMINRFVESRTKGLIPTILNDAPEDAGLIAINALHFKDRWKVSFNPAETRLAPFHKANGKSVDVPMMHLTQGRYPFRQNDKFIAVELSYAADDYKLVVVTTKKGAAHTRAFMGVADWLGGQDFALQTGEVAMPKFSSSETAELLDSLDALGLRSARKKSNALGGFSPMPQTISRIVQKTELRINEESTEAAAAAAVTTLRSISPEADYVKMAIDKPFLFALRDQRTGLILLAGYVGEPKADKIIRSSKNDLFR